MISKLDSCITSIACVAPDVTNEITTPWMPLKDAPKDCKLRSIDISNCSTVDTKLLDKMQYIKTKKGEFIKKRKKSDWVEVRFPNTETGSKKMEHLLNAQRELGEAGVSFDTSYDFGSKTREWQMDWALKGAIMDVT